MVMEMVEIRKVPEEVEWIAKVDVKGRIIIPSEVRELLNIKSGNYVKVKLLAIMNTKEET